MLKLKKRVLYILTAALITLLVLLLVSASRGYAIFEDEKRPSSGTRFVLDDACDADECAAGECVGAYLQLDAEYCRQVG